MSLRNLSPQDQLDYLVNAIERFMLQHHVQHDHHDEPTVWEHIGFSADNKLEHALASLRPEVWTAIPTGLAFTGLARDVYGAFHYTRCPLCREGERVSPQDAMEVRFSCGSTWSEARRTDAKPENWDVKCERWKPEVAQ